MSRSASRHEEQAAQTRAEAVAVEEPLEIRLDDAPVAVVMRTPGDDFELAAGFLLGEGLLEGPDEIAGVAYCRSSEAVAAAADGRDAADRVSAATADGRDPTNVVSVATAGGGGAERVAGRRRAIITSSACGLCGRVSLDEVHRRIASPGPPPKLRAADLHRAVTTLRSEQPRFEETGSTHGAAVLAPDLTPIAAFEDVGRHNAVDKCVGRLAFREALPLGGHLLVVSGRISFEIVQKALSAGIPAIAAVGGATSLAIDLARSADMLLVGFVREGRCTVYGGALVEATGSE